MGRRKKRVMRLRLGTLYFLDRRIKSFFVLKKVVSRQLSLNLEPENLSVFQVPRAPLITTLVVASHETFFGKEYSKILVGSENQETLIGYVLVSSLSKIVRGKLKWATDHD